ncbi:MAG: sugar ABC transporter permease [Candidatus Latescibacterota bacterium]|nr:sugar ABC transporter permease [Candidatus Latescibacterota bacterium]
MNKTQRRDLALGLGFLAPNIIGFLVFTLGPLLFSLYLAFTNWDLRLHNMFKDEPLRFVLLENFSRMLNDPDFWQYLINTLFLMISIPFSIAGSLFAAILLSKDTDGGNNWVRKRLIAGAALVFGVSCLVLAGAGSSAIVLLIVGLAGAIMVGGTLGGTTVYRTLFFLPHFTSGVATYILWKKLYNPNTGPITTFLRPSLELTADLVNGLPAGVVQFGSWLTMALMLVLVVWGLRRFVLSWRDGEMGWISVLLGLVFLSLPPIFSCYWAQPSLTGWLVAGGGVLALLATAGIVSRGRDYTCQADEGLGNGIMLGAVLMIGQFALLGLGIVLHMLPSLATDGLETPEWLTQYDWAKPSLMFMGMWAAIGSNNMLLYLAGLSNVPGELYEAAEIDGTSSFQKFWNVTWPQLAPVTFFIVVMSTIGGLQGGFEMARVMTAGGPAGSTTTLSYYVYNEGFTTGRLGYAAGVAWAMFVLVFSVTVFNWKFGSRQIND